MKRLRMLMWMGRRRPMRHPIWYLRSRGYQEGMRDGRILWQIIGVAVWSGYVYKKVMNSPPELIYRTTLKPGETLTVASHEPAGKRRGRRRGRAA